MTPERWQQVERLFQAAMAVDPVDRPSFLDRACQGDLALRSEVESLIASHDRAKSGSSGTGWQPRENTNAPLR